MSIFKKMKPTHFKTFCENVYQKSSSSRISHVTSSSTSDFPHSCPSRFLGAKKYQEENDGFNFNEENDDDYDDKRCKEYYQQTDNKNASLEYNLLQDSHNQKTLANLREQFFTNKFPDKGLPTRQVMRDIYLEV